MYTHLHTHPTQAGHVLTQTQMHTHAHTHTRTHTCMHILHMQVMYSHKHMHTRTHGHTYTHSHAHPTHAGHVPLLRTVDPIPQRPTPAPQPMDQRCALGVQAPHPFHPIAGVLMAGVCAGVLCVQLLHACGRWSSSTPPFSSDHGSSCGRCVCVVCFVRN